MCELLCIASESPARLDLSMEALALHGAPDSLNRDGWGVASFQNHDARLVKEPAPAGASEIVRFIEEHDYWSTTVLYHLRHASQGAICYENTQPFVRELGGRAHVFCHNGNLAREGGRLERGLGRFRPIGDTDSELAFCGLLARLEESWLASSGPPSVEHRTEVVQEYAAELRALGTANFLYADSDLVFLHSHWRPTAGEGTDPMPGLHVLTETESWEGAAVSIGPTAGALFVAASVPLSPGPWRPLAEGELIAVRAGRVVVGEGVRSPGESP